MERDDIYYQAMLARDFRFDGKFYVGVKTTKIYCRPICPAKPKRENVEFFPSAHLAEFDLSLRSWTFGKPFVETIPPPQETRMREDSGITDKNPFGLRRLRGNPIIHPGLHPSIGHNINGPSLIRVPDWLPNPLGHYYLYFSSHNDTFIRLAYADHLEGPWTVHAPGTLTVEQAAGFARFHGHVASPDVHIDDANRRIVMFYHGSNKHSGEFGLEGQVTGVAWSTDGLHFDQGSPDLLGKFYFRVFRHRDTWYAFAKGMPSDLELYRARDPFRRWEKLWSRDVMRHLAVLLRGDRALLFYSHWSSTPERLQVRSLHMDGAPEQWRLGDPMDLLFPEFEWEGAMLPVAPSFEGLAREPVHQLRDPAIYEEGSRVYLLYSVAGESGIAIAELPPSLLEDRLNN